MVSDKHSNFLTILAKSIKRHFIKRKLLATIITIFSFVLNSLLLFTTFWEHSSSCQFMRQRNYFIDLENDCSYRSQIYIGAKSFLSLTSFAILLLEMVLKTTKNLRKNIFLSSLWITFALLAVIYFDLALLWGNVLDRIIRADDPNFVLKTHTIILVGISGPLVFSYMHLFVNVWVLATVIWVNEEGGSCKIEAVRKAVRFMEGKRLNGFILIEFPLSLSRLIDCLMALINSELNQPSQIFFEVVLTVTSCGSILFDHFSCILVYYYSHSKKMRNIHTTPQSRLSIRRATYLSLPL